ncbi:hypothetical protein DRJ17_07095 [Candidatus Woesearchaeota archaeon]|mgnify:CR=1 FL=1|nr:MAG: hypothetical protein DRJ17_07095 [Candidatus Woesearchaeota archaeon]
MQIQVKTYKNLETRYLFDLYVLIREDETGREYEIYTDLNKAINKFKADVDEYSKYYKIQYVEPNNEYIKQLVIDLFAGEPIEFTEVVKSAISKDEEIAVILLRAKLYAYVIDFTPLYELGNPEYGVKELARFIIHYYRVGKLLLASSPDVGDYYVAKEFSECREKVSEDKRDLDEAVLQCYVEKYYKTSIPTFVYIYDGYEYAIIDCSNIEKFDIKYVKIRRVGNSNVVAFPSIQRDYVRRVIISEDLVLYDTL